MVVVFGQKDRMITNPGGAIHDAELAAFWQRHIVYPRAKSPLQWRAMAMARHSMMAVTMPVEQVDVGRW